jgi:hypothetical protein
VLLPAPALAPAGVDLAAAVSAAVASCLAPLVAEMAAQREGRALLPSSPSYAAAGASALEALSENKNVSVAAAA